MDKKEDDKPSFRFEEECFILLSQVFEGVFVQDLNGNILEINPPGLDILGYSKEEISSINIKEIIQDEAINQSEDFMEEIGEEKDFSKTETRELQVKRKDGTRIWIEFKASMIKRDGQTLIQGIFRDITERKRSERALKSLVRTITSHTGEKLFDSLVEQIIEWFDLDGAFVGKISENRQIISTLAMKAFDEPIEVFEFDLPGTPCENILDSGPCLVREGSRDRFEGNIGTDEFDVEGYMGVPLKNSAGISIGILCGFSLSKIENIPSNWYNILEIISSRLSVEIERIEREDELHNIKEAVQTSDESIYIFDTDLKYIFANEEHIDRLYHAEEISHRSESKLLGKRYSEIQSGDDEKRLEEDLRTVLETKDSLKKEHKSIHAGRWSSRTYTPVKDADTGKVESIIVISKDITKRKKMEKELERHIKEKENIIKRLSHDLKTPIGPIVNLLPLIKEKIQENYPDEKLIYDLKICQENAIYLKNLLDHILKVAKFTRSGTELEKTDLRNFVEDWKKGFERRHHEKLQRKKKIYILNRIDENICLELDQISFSEVLDNLVINSVKNISEEGKVVFRTEDKDEKITLILEDTGTGIDEKQLEELFNYFQQKAPAEHEVDSIGLGLPISKYIIENHNGEIQAENRNDEGARFCITLPKIKGEDYE